MSKESLIEVIGGEITGEKAGMLMEHEPVIKEVGLDIPPTTVIASETVQASMRAHQIPNNATIEGLRSVSARYRESLVLAIRSSAEGDAGGNGVYESRFSTNDGNLIFEAARLVIESFTAQPAVDFRRQASLGEEFAVMVQPVVGQDLGGTEFWEHYGPFLSGLGYSASSEHPEGFINVVAGIGGGVNRSGGQILSPAIIKDTFDKSILVAYEQKTADGLSFYNFLKALHEAALDIDNTSYQSNDFRSGNPYFPKELVEKDFALAEYLIRARGESHFGYKKLGLLSAGIEEYTGKKDDQGQPIFEFMESEFLGATKQFVPEKLIKAMHQMERIAGYPVYIEWALRAKNDNLQPVILQIAPAEITARSRLEAKIEGKKIAEAHNLVGHGEKSASKIVAVAGNYGVDALIRFNEDSKNEGYVVIFSSTLASSRNLNHIRYGDVSNAGVILEIEADELINRHARGDLAQHLLGASRQTDKFIGMFPVSSEVPKLWTKIFGQGKEWFLNDDEYTRFEETNPSLFILDGTFSIYADETTGKIVVTEETI